MSDLTKPMRQSTANSCEWAIWPRCLCKCLGKLHGIKHGRFVDLYNQRLDENGEITEADIEEIVTQI